MKTIKIQKIPHSRINQVDFDNLSFGNFYTDHMFSCTYKEGEWQEGIVKPFEDIKLSPTSSVFHYGQAIFEGMKAYKNKKGEVFLFRPEENLKRFNKSAIRLNMPTISEDIFIEGLKKLIDVDREWIPKEYGKSLYIRPFMIATSTFLKAQSSYDFLFMIVCSPAGHYFDKPIRVKVECEYLRAHKGGVGFAKTAGNYAAAFYPTKLAQKEGYDQVLWMDASGCFIEESGTMNLFFYIDDYLITPEITDTILSGITRSSLIDLIKKEKAILGLKDIKEQKVSIKEITDAFKGNKIKEAFGAGTAAITNSIESISYKGENFSLPIIKKEEERMAFKLKNRLLDIQYGCVEDNFGWRLKV